jgi:hypothetical protein
MKEGHPVAREGVYRSEVRHFVHWEGVYRMEEGHPAERMGVYRSVVWRKGEYGENSHGRGAHRRAGIPPHRRVVKALSAATRSPPDASERHPCRADPASGQERFSESVRRGKGEYGENSHGRGAHRRAGIQLHRRVVKALSAATRSPPDASERHPCRADPANAGAFWGKENRPAVRRGGFGGENRQECLCYARASSGW